MNSCSTAFCKASKNPGFSGYIPACSKSQMYVRSPFALMPDHWLAVRSLKSLRTVKQITRRPVMRSFGQIFINSNTLLYARQQILAFSFLEPVCCLLSSFLYIFRGNKNRMFCCVYLSTLLPKPTGAFEINVM